MNIGTKAEYLKIEELERNSGGSPCAGDVNLSVALFLQEFSGSYDGIWLELLEM